MQPDSPTPAVTPFRYVHRVVYAECTVGNHIYHSRYLDLLEAARGEFMRHAGHPVAALQDAGFIFPVVEARLRYHRPARYDDLLHIELTLIELRGARLGVRHRITRASDGVLLFEGDTRHVCTSLQDKPRRMPPDLVAALSPWRVSEPDPEEAAGGQS